MAKRELRGTRYLTKGNEEFARFLIDELPFMDFEETVAWYEHMAPALDQDQQARALLGCNDRFFLLAVLCHRADVLHPWLFARCREVEDDPDGYLDLWARYHYKSTIGTFAGVIQEIMRDPEITVAIMSCTNAVAEPFLSQIKQELEANEDLQATYPDVLYPNPAKQSPQWSMDGGIVVKRRSNPKEATVEAFGVIDGMRTGKHFRLLVYDDLVTERLVTNTEMIQKVTDRWELSDNLGSDKGTRKWHWGTRYSFADSYGVLLERGTLKPRIHAATVDGTLKSDPVFLSPKRWAEVMDAQRRTVSAQMLLNPVAGTESTFRSEWLKTYEVIPAILNVYIMADPSRGVSNRSDRTAIAVVGIDPAGNRYLLDGVRHRMKLSDRWQYLKQLRAKWLEHPGVQLVRVGYERYGMQSDLEVIEDWQRKEDIPFEIEELNTPQRGKHSKNDRIERLEPDLRGGRFYLPCLVHHPDHGNRDNVAYWQVWTEEDAKKAEGQPGDKHSVGHIIYRPMQGLTRQQRFCEATAQKYRIVTAIKRRDENNDVYDLTRAFMEEMMFHPAAPHDDLLDAVSRLYDMEPVAPIQFEGRSAEAVEYPDA